MRAQAEVLSSHAPTSAVSRCLVQTHPHPQAHPISNQREAEGREPGGTVPHPSLLALPLPASPWRGVCLGRGGGGASTGTKGELTRMEFTVGEVDARRRERMAQQPLMKGKKRKNEGGKKKDMATKKGERGGKKRRMVVRDEMLTLHTYTCAGRLFKAPKKPNAKREHQLQEQVTKLVNNKNLVDAQRKALKEGGKFTLFQEPPPEAEKKKKRLRNGTNIPAPSAT